MRIAYYTSGISGWGHLVQGVSIARALARAGVRAEYRMFTSGAVPPFLSADTACVRLPAEGKEELSGGRHGTSALFRAFKDFAPDVLLVDLHWFMIHFLASDLRCRKIFLCREVHPSFFTIALRSGTISFRPGDYDLALATEPFGHPFPMEEINPVVLRNPDEILSRREACRRLDLDPADRHCFFTFKENPREELAVRKTYAYLGEEGGYRMVYAADYENGLFPAADYFNACDLLVTGAGYNSFWEARHFRKDAIFIPMPRNFENTYRRVAELSDYEFDGNGADQLVRRMMDSG